MIRVIPSPEFDRLATRFRFQSKRIWNDVAGDTLDTAADEGERLARDNLEAMVYGTPENPYYERTMRTYNAIKTRPLSRGPEQMSRTVLVDRNDYPAFFYALSLNFGVITWYWWGRLAPPGRIYEARPFWSDMTQEMRVTFFEEGGGALRRLRVELLR